MCSNPKIHNMADRIKKGENIPKEEMGEALISTEEFNLKLDTCVLTCRRFVKENGHTPLKVVVVGTNGKKLTEKFATPKGESWGASFDNREQAMMELAHRMYAHRETEGWTPVAIFAISEAWVAEAKYDEHGEPVMPSENRDRKEILSIMGMTIDGRTNMASMEIERDYLERPTLGLPEFHRSGGDEEQGHGESPLLKAFWETYRSVSTPLTWERIEDALHNIADVLPEPMRKTFIEGTLKNMRKKGLDAVQKEYHNFRGNFQGGA